MNDGSCVRLRPERPNHVWSDDFVQDRTHDDRVFRTRNIVDDHTREALTDLFILRGPPEHIRSDNGPEFVAEKVTPACAAQNP